MIRTRALWQSGLFLGAIILAIAFLLLPVAAILGVGLYYSLGILLVADLTQVTAALGRETDIAPALLQTPLVAMLVALLASVWGLGLSVLWRNWLSRGHRVPILLSALPLLLPRFGLGALFLLACLQLAQWGGDALGLGLVAFSQAAVATPLVAAILCLGWRRSQPSWRMAALEAGADEITIFRRLDWPVLRPYLILGAGLAFILSMGDFYLGNALAGDRALLSGVLFSGVARNASPLYHALAAALLLLDFCFVIALYRRLRPIMPL
jgi:ABC-type spermidine/putrescine transport system permease subunit II